ncbi:MAG: hypothetical protein EBV06_17485, partial [Planctomycetia bacterium]|nr:hypothetical protein [Planctomycetia bacterium]
MGIFYQMSYFVGIDSDGTVFDSMEVKQKRVFQPMALELWGLQAVENQFREAADFINLYSTHRGTNRFQGLVMVFENLRRNSALARQLPDPSALREFVLSGRSLS